MKRKTPSFHTPSRKAGSTKQANGPILEVATLHNIDTDLFELEITFEALDGKRKCRVPRRLENDLRRILETLMDKGADFSQAPNSPKDALENALALRRETRCITSQSGWHKKAYVLPGATIAAEGDPDGTLTFDAGPHQKTGIDLHRGTLSRWKAGLRAPCKASRYLTFSIALAFAGPLMKWVRCELSEGAIFLLAGQSGTGKTVTCRAAQSVFGRSGQAEMATFDFTPRASEELFALHNDGTLVLDEVGRAGANVDERRRKLADLAYTAPSGRGRIRSKRVQSDGLSNQTWTVNCLGSTEEKIDDDGKAVRRRGEQVRLIELAVPLKSDGGIFDRAPAEGSEMAAQVGKTVDKNYGLALRQFLLELVNDKSATATALAAFRAFLKLTEQERPGRDQRLASKFALVFAAGMLARQYKVAPWARQGLRDSVLTLWRGASVTFDGQSSRHMEAARRVQELVSDRRILTKLKRGASMPKTAIGMNRTLDERQEIVFYPPRLARALGMSVANTDGVMAHFRQAGALIPDASGFLKQQVRIAGLKQVKPRCYVLDRQKLLDMRFIA